MFWARRLWARRLPRYLLELESSRRSVASVGRGRVGRGRVGSGFFVSEVMDGLCPSFFLSYVLRGSMIPFPESDVAVTKTRKGYHTLSGERGGCLAIKGGGIYCSAAV